MNHQYRKVLFLPLAVACAALPGFAWADTKSDLEARYAQLSAAVDTREPKEVKPLITADFAEVSLDGRKQTMDEKLDRLVMVPVDPSRKPTLTIESIEEQGDVAKVKLREANSGSREGRDGQTHTFSMSRLSLDTWVKSDKGWQLQSSEAEEMTMSRDGQVMRTLKKGDKMPERGPGGGRRGPGGPGGPGGDGPPMGPPPGED